MSDPKPLGPAELNSGDLAGRVAALESVVHSWVEVCRELRGTPPRPDFEHRLGTLAEELTDFGDTLNRLDAVVGLLCRAKTRDRLRRIKRHRYPKPKGKL